MIKAWSTIETIYVACPAGYATGGTELLHQLVHALRQINKNAYIYYYLNAEAGRPKVFDCYDTPLQTPTDSPSSLIIVPEVAIHVLATFPKSTPAVWWLSVNGFWSTYLPKTQSSTEHTWPIRLLFSMLPKGIIFKDRFQANQEIPQTNWNPLTWLKDARVCYKVFRLARQAAQTATRKNIKDHWTHLSQSEYARLFLKQNGIDSIHLGDYLRDVFLDSPMPQTDQKENQVCFNPQKGYAFTQQLIKIPCKWNWVKLAQMTPDQIRETLAKSKVYIDFGTHPGKDRIPREAAMTGCVVITGLHGSAANPIDIPIDPAFKINQDSPDALQQSMKAIESALDNYAEAILEQKQYREKIRSEKSDFLTTVQKLFK